MGATAVAGAAGVTDFISVDMGGTSYDVCLVARRRARREGGLELAPPLPRRPADGRRADGRRGRRLDRAVEAGALQVGPRERRAPSPARSATAAAARARPSPTRTSCSATSTPTRFCGGAMRLDAEGARAAIREQRRRSRSASRWSRPPTASSGSSTRTWRTPSARSRRRRRRSAPSTLVVFGGNGPVHAGMQAAELGIRRILVPEAVAGVLGARPAAHRPRGRRDALVRHADRPRVDLARVNRLFAEMEAAARARAGGRRADARRSELRRIGRALLPGPDLRHGRAARAGRGGPVTRARSRGDGRALPPPARGAAHLRRARPGARGAVGARPDGRPHRTAHARREPAGRRTARARAARAASGVVRRALRGHAGLRRRARRRRARDPRTRDRRGALHHVS